MCFALAVSAQSFTKITVGAIVTDSANNFECAWGDYDKDGDLDLYVTTEIPSVSNSQCLNYLHQNNCNGSFTRVRAMPGGLVSDQGATGGAIWVDYNDDGNLDLFVNNGVNPRGLYQNNADGTFSKITGINIVDDITRFAQPTVVDYDNDGKLDFFMINNSESHSLYHNNGDGTYTSITEGPLVNEMNDIFGGAWADYDNDGDMDIFITTKWSQNYQNYLYDNNGDGTFSKNTATELTNDPRMLNYKYGINYSCNWADYDNDGDLDIFVSSVFGVGDYLYRNNGDGTFTSLTDGPVVNNARLDNGGSSWGDYDNDGDLDLIVASFNQNLFYINNGDGTFTQNTTEIIASDTTVESYGMAWADYDNDGDLDLFVPNGWGAPNDFLYMNIYSNNGNTNHWMKFECEGTVSNRSAIGTRIYLKALINGQSVWQMREISAHGSRGGGGTSGASGNVVHFGLGDASIIDSIRVVWPASGIEQIFTQVAADRFIHVIENQNVLVEVPACVPDLPVENPGIVKGKIFNDLDGDCTYNELNDELLANKIVKATVGDFFVLTNSIGEYEIRLPEGSYDISRVERPDEIYSLPDCNNTDSIYSVNVLQQMVLEGYDYIVKGDRAPCGISVIMISPTLANIPE
ncbi:MAG: CRTAC1 family protein [Bacteroidetes bacterium]|nr:CRTAC1 family protein [Bacteroidota bacterium]MBU1718487.1 CRTAC1 family protein [Bacteroidota bacterium]